MLHVLIRDTAIIRVRRRLPTGDKRCSTCQTQKPMTEFVNGEKCCFVSHPFPAIYVPSLEGSHIVITRLGVPGFCAIIRASLMIVCVQGVLRAPSVDQGSDINITLQDSRLASNPKELHSGNSRTQPRAGMKLQAHTEWKERKCECCSNRTLC